jgi:hypothetical protein
MRSRPDTKAALRRVATAMVALCTACSAGESPPPGSEPAGPPFLRPDVIERHAREFDTDLSERRAGTQAEQAASAYILGHLQQAGYVVLLDSVPLADLVRSTNVIAEPPGGRSPSMVVAVPYDEPPDPHTARREGAALGLMLELARALRAAAPQHGVEFVALGAEYADVGGGRLGSRRLAQTLLDDDARPLVLTFDIEATSPSPFLAGDVPPALESAAAESFGDSVRTETAIEGSGSVFARAGLRVVVIGGRVAEWGDPLLAFLASEAP